MRKEFRKLKKIKRKESFLKSRFFLFGVGAAVVLEFLLYGIVLLPFIQVQEVRVQGNENVSENHIKSVVLHGLWRKFLFLPTASILLIDTKAMQNALLETIPELELVNIRRKLPNVLIVAVQEKETAVLWCQELSCVAVDKTGIAFKNADPSPESITVYGQERPMDLKETVLERDVLDAIVSFAKEAKRRSIFSQDGLSFEIMSESQIHARIGEGWSVYFTHTEDLSWQITKLQTVLENKIPFEKRKKLEYIDVRFGDQAYLKYR